MKLQIRILFFAAFFFLYFISSAKSFAQESVEIKPEEGGFIGISFPLSFAFQNNKINGESFKTNHFSLPVQVIGASSDFAVVTNMLIAADLLRLSNYYKEYPGFGEKGEIYSFSFFSFEVLYEAYSFKTLKFHLGIAFGHQGFLIKESPKSHSLFGGFSAASYWFFHENFYLRYKFQVPAGLYNKNIEKLLYLKHMLEITFDPIGPILNPSPNSAFFSAGFMLELASFRSFDKDASFMHYKPYLAATVLY
ncbi:MAG: hypothetical protein OEZ13_07255 [Spirochaetia bacterium]|nr:hypothetical protein [Spirochaetia bacterium]